MQQSSGGSRSRRSGDISVKRTPGPWPVRIAAMAGAAPRPGGSCVISARCEAGLIGVAEGELRTYRPASMWNGSSRRCRGSGPATRVRWPVVIELASAWLRRRKPPLGLGQLRFRRSRTLPVNARAPRRGIRAPSLDGELRSAARSDASRPAREDRPSSRCLRAIPCPTRSAALGRRGSPVSLEISALAVRHAPAGFSSRILPSSSA